MRSAQALQQAAAAQPPAGREAWWQAARAQLGGGAGPGGIERLRARVALEWAAGAGQPGEADDLLALRPSAWVLLRAGGAEPLADMLLAEAAARGVPCLVLDADPPAGALFSQSLTLAPPAEALCADAEAEAQAACAQVLAELAAQPDARVALVAQDREAVRRVRALLERFGVPVVDDTGWRLATTRAAARVVALLRSAQGLRPGRSDTAAADQRLDWLKDDPLGLARPDALAALEAQWRGQRVGDDAAEAAAALWDAGQARLAPLHAAPRSLPLRDWLARLAAICLAEPAEAARWRDDAAGRAVLASLRLEPPASTAPDWQAAAQQAAMTLDEFVAWVDEVLDEASFVPPHDAQARVTVAPLARAILRPFDAVVFPGCDERRLGAAEPAPDLIAPAVADALGLDGLAARRQREALAFAQLLRLPRVTLLRRRAEGNEPLGAAALVDRLRLAWQAAPGGPRALVPAAPRLPLRQAATQPLQPPQPQATAGWPDALSASQVEALRACPYRFFSRVLLGLGEVDELDRSVAKRDYGNWLHLVLYRFHDGRTPGQGLAADRARLHQMAAQAEAEAGHADGELLPFLASFEALVGPYLAWLHEREARGWQWRQGELDRRTRPPALDGLALQGRIDRLDRDDAGRLQVLDYKTGSVQGLQSQLRDRTEDTQLAFYAALVLGEGDVAPAALSAAYLALDDREGPTALEHADVAATAQALVDGLGGELRRARAGEPLQALGQGPVCEHCEARGLCRRDQWSTAA
ncbi:MAG: PD-(D/E)XK nuclease family protein [Burkholderiaceae bacterium]